MFSLLSLPSLTCPTHNDIYIPSARPRLTIDILSSEKKNSICSWWQQSVCLFLLVFVLGSICPSIYLAEILMLISMIIRFTQSTESSAILIPNASSQGLFFLPLDTTSPLLDPPGILQCLNVRNYPVNKIDE